VASFGNSHPVTCKDIIGSTVTFNQCTIVSNSSLWIHLSDNLPPGHPTRVKFLIDKTVLATLEAFNPVHIVELVSEPAFTARTKADLLDYLGGVVTFGGEKSVRFFPAANIKTSGVVIGALSPTKGPVRFLNTDDELTQRFQNLPIQDRTLQFEGPNLERMRKQFSILDAKSMFERHKAALPLLWALTPGEFVVTSSGPLAKLRVDGIKVGCDASVLPVPPPATLQP
jgi:hypothetical protein